MKSISFLALKDIILSSLNSSILLHQWLISLLFDPDSYSISDNKKRKCGKDCNNDDTNFDTNLITPLRTGSSNSFFHHFNNKILPYLNTDFHIGHKKKLFHTFNSQEQYHYISYKLSTDFQRQYSKLKNFCNNFHRRIDLYNLSSF